tara:strand:+ start:609 stop:806 length:198 start_codon:yes stop_codon:yes gene_type:complete
LFNNISLSLCGVDGGVLKQSDSQPLKQLLSQCLNFSFSKKLKNNVNDETIKFIVIKSIFKIFFIV